MKYTLVRIEGASEFCFDKYEDAIEFLNTAFETSRDSDKNKGAVFSIQEAETDVCR